MISVDVGFSSENSHKNLDKLTKSARIRPSPKRKKENIMINKKKSLGKNPDGIGDKDAIHVAIVSVVANKAIQPGERIRLNPAGQAEPVVDGGFGIADPFIGQICRGDMFWAIVDPDSVERVSHTWEHLIEFPTLISSVKRNSTLENYANLLHVTYEQLLVACLSYARTGRKHPYPGTLTIDEGELVVDKFIEISDLWYEWADESGYKFENCGSDCCPEYDYPSYIPFEWV